jgi:hypothetical protein
VAVKNASLNYEHQFYLNGVLLSGVTNVGGGYSIDESPINIIGKGHAFPVRNGPLVGNFDITKYYVGQETLLQYIDNTPISGSINYGDKSFGFTNGYLSEYSISFGIGQIPESQASITVYGGIGKGIDANNNEPHPEIQIPNQGSIELNVSGYSTNRVTSFNYSVRVNRKPIYQIGSHEPIQIMTEFPISQQANFQIDIDDYEVNNIKEYLLNPQQQDINIIVKNPINENAIDSFTIKNARLLSQNVNAGSMDLLSLSLVYDGYINRKDRQYNPIIWTINHLSGDGIAITGAEDRTPLPSSSNSYVVPINYTYSNNETLPTDIAFVTESLEASTIDIIEVNNVFAMLNTDFSAPALSLDPNHATLQTETLADVVNIINQRGVHTLTAYRSVFLRSVDVIGASNTDPFIQIFGDVNEESHSFYGITDNAVIKNSENNLFFQVTGINVTTDSPVRTQLEFDLADLNDLPNAADSIMLVRM